MEKKNFNVAKKWAVRLIFVLILVEGGLQISNILENYFPDTLLTQDINEIPVLVLGESITQKNSWPDHLHSFFPISESHV